MSEGVNLILTSKGGKPNFFLKKNRSKFIILKSLEGSNLKLLTFQYGKIEFFKNLNETNQKILRFSK